MFNREKFVPGKRCRRYSQFHARAEQDKPSGNRKQFSTFARGWWKTMRKGILESPGPPLGAPFPPSLHLRAVHLALPLAFYRSFLRPSFLSSFHSFYLCLYTRRLGAFILLLSFKRPTRRDAPWEEIRRGLVQRLK